MIKENNLKIGDFLPTDQEEIVDLVSKILKEHGFQLNQQLDSDLYDIKNEYLKFFIIRSQQNIIGCIGIKKLSNKLAQFKRLYVLPEERGRGMGRELLQKAINFCLKHGFEKIVLDTTIRNKTAIKLFKEFGFQEIKKEGENLFFEKKL